ncbi:MAG: M64 family metallopeptidase [Marinilabiliaceae bacterium]
MIRSVFFIFLLVCIFQTDDIFAKNNDALTHNKSLRIDFILSGNQSMQEATVSAIYEVPGYSSGPDQDIPPFDYGNYRIVLLSTDSPDTLFLKGFCTLFQEWQSTKEAKKRRRTFKQTIEMPFPKKEVEWVLEYREKTGNFTELARETFHPEKDRYTRLVPAKYPQKIIHGNDDAKDRADILIMAEGYTSEEKDRFYADAKKMAGSLLALSPYDSLKNHITIRALAIPSKDSGTNDPNNNIWKNTPLKSSFNTFGTDRYLESLHTWTIFDHAAGIPHDHIIILVNTAKYGGGGVYNHFSITSAQHSNSPKVFIHELGHGLAGLGDEYFSTDVAYGDFFDLNTEPWHPNITTLKDFEGKWEQLVADSVPIPTPDISKYRNTTGVFEGAGYSARDIYRPAVNCRMRSNEAKGFCEVCREAIRKMILFYSQR